MIPHQHDPHAVADGADRLAELAGVGPGLWDGGELPDGQLPAIPGAEATGDDVCGQSRDYWYCSREPGHPGRHLACLYRDTVIAAWPGTHEPTQADLTGPAGGGPA